MKKVFYLTLFLSLVSISAQASQEPRPLGSDNRIKHVMFDPNEVYEISTSYGFQTVVEFSPRENILVASIGDSIGWQVVPAVNKLFIKPIANDAVTNMTVVTDQRTYYFNLIALRSEAVGDMTYLVRFNYPAPPPIYEGLSTGPKNPADLNFNYKVKNREDTGLIRVFDDGQFTYLQFENRKELPAIFVVGPDGKESLANFRIKKPYVVIEQLTNELVLRTGKEKTKVYNKGYSGPVQV